MDLTRLQCAQVTTIHLDWSGPYSLDEASALTGREDYGLYQFYGDHPVYGAGVLLYVGKASNQSFGRRLSQHNWGNWIPSQAAIYIGKVCTPEPLDDKEWCDAIEEPLIVALVSRAY